MWTLTHSNATANATAAGSSNTTDVSGTSSLPVQNATGRAMDPAAATPTAAVGTAAVGTAAAAASSAVPHSTSGGTAAAPGTTAYSASSLVSADSANQAVHPQRVLRAVLTAGIPGGPTAAVRIDPSMAAWIRRWQVLHPCPAA